jgi:O-antigen/teichoic acid export membrane protein
MRAGRALTDAFQLGSGTAFAQAINFVALLWISSLYTPAAFGTFAVFSSLAWLANVLATGQYEHLIMQLRTRSAELHLAAFIGMLSSSFALLIGLLVWGIAAFGAMREDLVGGPLLAVLAWLPLTLLMIGTNQALRYLSLGREKFRAIGFGVLAMAAASNVCAAALAATGEDARGLVLGQLVGYAINNLVLAWTLRRSFSGARLRWRRALRLGRCLLPRAANLTVAYGSRTAFGRLPTFIVAALGDERILGAYALAERLISAPALVVARAFSDVFRQRASVLWKQRGDLAALIGRTLSSGFAVGIPAYVVGIAAAPMAFALALGQQWSSAGEIARVLLLGEFFVFVGTPIEAAAVVMGMSRYLAAWNVGRLAAKLLILLGVWLGGGGLAFVLWSLVAVRASFYLLDFAVVYESSRRATWMRVSRA